MELPGPLVDADWLASHLDDVHVVDVRWAIDTGPQRDLFLEGHLPGAVFADLDVDLSAPPGFGGRHPLPTPEAFATARGRLGLDGRPVVAYDHRGGPVASRLWWMLDSIGLPAAVLDGGISAWPGELETGEVNHQLNTAPVSIAWPSDRYVEADDIPMLLGDGSVLIDARSSARFRGEPNPIEANPGHIPGARSRPWDQNLTEDGVFAPLAQLKADFAAHGIDEDSALLASCGSGVTACHDLLAARLLGITNARLYVGSWSEWSQSDRPIEVGE